MAPPQLLLALELQPVSRSAFPLASKCSSVHIPLSTVVPWSWLAPVFLPRFSPSHFSSRPSPVPSAGALLPSVCSLTRSLSPPRFGLPSPLLKCFPVSPLPLGMPNTLKDHQEASLGVGISWYGGPPGSSTHTRDCL